MNSTIIKQEAVSLLQRLITTPSFSKQEEGTAAILVEFLKQWGAEPYRVGNNVYAHVPNINDFTFVDTQGQSVVKTNLVKFNNSKICCKVNQKSSIENVNDLRF